MIAFSAIFISVWKNIDSFKSSWPYYMIWHHFSFHKIMLNFSEKELNFGRFQLSGLICLVKPYGVIPFCDAHLLVPYCNGMTISPRRITDSGNERG